MPGLCPDSSGIVLEVGFSLCVRVYLFFSPSFLQPDWELPQGRIPYAIKSHSIPDGASVWVIRRM
jgi:hypothetical protein